MYVITYIFIYVGMYACNNCNNRAVQSGVFSANRRGLSTKPWEPSVLSTNVEKVWPPIKLSKATCEEVYPIAESTCSVVVNFTAEFVEEIKASTFILSAMASALFLKIVK